MIDFRSLFDRYHVHWRDRGANVSHNNIVISCPFCNRSSNPDHGEHLSISTHGEYFCYRNPSHKGRYLPRLFRLLNIPQHEYADLDFGVKEVVPEKKDDNDYSIVSFFQKAEENQEALEYLSSRLFNRPVEICKRFRLMTSKEGKWAGRLIIPLTVGWTGRAMRNHIEPRYLAYTNEDGFFLYRNYSSSCIIVEGAVDAMKIAAVSTQFDVVAKCGSRLSSALLNHLRQAKYFTIYNIPDGDVTFLQAYEETKLLKSYCTYGEVKKFELRDFKDFGAMEEHQTRNILIHLTERIMLDELDKANRYM